MIFGIENSKFKNKNAKIIQSLIISWVLLSQPADIPNPIQSEREINKSVKKSSTEPIKIQF